MRVVSVTNGSSGPPIGDRVHVASSSLTRMVGLLGKPGLDTGGGLWIKPSSGVHTVGMKFTIDVIGLDSELKVVKLWRKLVPYRLTSVSWKMTSVIELPAGRIDECGVKLGDTLTIKD